jgi:hypothetical protein
LCRGAAVIYNVTRRRGREGREKLLGCLTVTPHEIPTTF